MHLIFHDFPRLNMKLRFSFFVSEEFRYGLTNLESKKKEIKVVKRFWNGQKTNMTYAMLGHGNMLTKNETQK